MHLLCYLHVSSDTYPKDGTCWRSSDLRGLIYPLEKTILALYQLVNVQVAIAWESRSKQA